MDFSKALIALNTDIPTYSYWHMKLWAVPFFVGVMIMSFWNPSVLVFFALGLMMRYLIDQILN